MRTMSTECPAPFWYACRMPRPGVKTALKSLALLAVTLVIAGGSVNAAEGTPAAPAPPPPAQEETSSYLIGPGDMLQVFVWRNPELSQTIPVRPDGRISTPLIENMVAVGKTPSQLARDMEVVLAEFVKAPKVNIIVTQPVSTFSQVKVVGQVTHPQSLAFREGMTVLDVVLQVGGLGPFASGNRAKIIRADNGKQQEIHVKLADLVNKGDMKQNVRVKPGDVLIVPQSLF